MYFQGAQSPARLRGRLGLRAVWAACLATPRRLNGHALAPLPCTKGAPDRPGFVAPERWAANVINWEPGRVQLTDAGVVYALLSIGATKRGLLFPFDFNKKGDIRLGRVPRGQTVLVTQNNVNFLLAFRDTYILTGAPTSTAGSCVRHTQTPRHAPDTAGYGQAWSSLPSTRPAQQTLGA